MSPTTLYEQLSVAAHGAGLDRGRTDKSTSVETIDKDRHVLDLYASLCDPVIAGDSDVGETDITRQETETIDRDRADQTLNSSLLGPPTDLYGVLACSVASAAGDRGETTRTLTTDETIDEGWAPEHPYA
jgi:hypothetical protein